MCPDGYPIQETQNWQSGFLPGVYEGTYIDTQHTAIEQLIEHIRNDRMSLPQQREQLDLLRAAQRPPSRRPGRTTRPRSPHPVVRAGFRMQTEAADAFDVTPRAAAHPRHVRPRRAGPADC